MIEKRWKWSLTETGRRKRKREFVSANICALPVEVRESIWRDGAGLYSCTSAFVKHTFPAGEAARRRINARCEKVVTLMMMIISRGGNISKFGNRSK